MDRRIYKKNRPQIKQSSTSTMKFNFKKMDLNNLKMTNHGTGRSPLRGASGYTRSCTAYIILPQIDDVPGHIQTHPYIKND